MGIRTKVLAIEQALDGMIDPENHEQISELLDDIRILSDAKDDVIKRLGGEQADTSKNSLHKHFVTHSAYQICPKCNGAKVIPQHCV